jgi:3-deoxy-7-phosphoheptulonate synthase
MIVVMRRGAPADPIEAVRAKVLALGFKPHLSQGEEQTIIGVIGDERRLSASVFETMDWVERVLPILKPFRLAGRDFHPLDTVVRVGDVALGARGVVLMAGPCAVESYEQTRAIAEAMKAAGVRILRGGAYKPRTSPYAFQGLGPKGLEILSAVGRELGLHVITEVMTPADMDLVIRHADILQIGARNMQNFALLAEAGRAKKPVLLKRGMMSSLEEFLMSAEYILSNGNPEVILCERGIRTFERYTRNTLDLSAVPLLKRLSHLPVAVDPSHATGERSLVAPMSLAAVACGADALLIDVHHKPEDALCDGPQALLPAVFADLSGRLKAVAEAVGRTLGTEGAARA